MPESLFSCTFFLLPTSYFLLLFLSLHPSKQYRLGVNNHRLARVASVARYN